MEAAASRIAEWVEWGGGLGQYERVLWSATNELEWDYPPNIKTLSIPMRRSRGGSPMESPPLDPEVEKTVDDFRLTLVRKGGLCPSTSWCELFCGERSLPSQTKTQKLPPGVSPL